MGQHTPLKGDQAAKLKEEGTYKLIVTLYILALCQGIWSHVTHNPPSFLLVVGVKYSLKKLS